MHADRGHRFTHDFLDVLRARAHRFAPAPRGDPAPRGAAAPRFAYITVMVFEPEGWQQTRNFRAGTVKTGDAGFLEACAPVAQQWLLKSGACRGPSCAHHYEVLTNNQTARRDLIAAGVHASMVPPALERAVEQFRLHAERTSGNVASFWSLAGLYKLAAVGMTRFEWVGVLDLDVSPYVLPLQWMLIGRRRATQLLGCSNSDERRESTMAPMNAGYLAFRPNASAYHDLLALLRSPPHPARNASNWDSSFDMWARDEALLERGARASEAAGCGTPGSSHHEGSMRMWPGAAIDQGLPFYFYAIKRSPPTLMCPFNCTVRGSMRSTTVRWREGIPGRTFARGSTRSANGTSRPSRRAAQLYPAIHGAAPCSARRAWAKSRVGDRRCTRCTSAALRSISRSRCGL